MSETIPIRADVPLTMHPDVLSQQAAALEVENTNGPAALAAGREALSAMYRVFAAMEDAEKALQKAAPAGSRTQHPDGRSEYLGDLRMVDGGLRRFHGREEEFAEAAGQAVTRASRTVDRRMAELKDIQSGLSRRIAAAVDYSAGRSGEGLVVAQEIRRHLKSMKPAERVPFLHKAVEAKDRQTVGAVLSAPAYLSGLDDASGKVLRDRAAATWAPVETAQFAAVGVIIDRVMHSGGDLMGRYMKALSLKTTAAGLAGSRLGELSRV